MSMNNILKISMSFVMKKDKKDNYKKRTQESVLKLSFRQLLIFLSP